MFTSFPQYYRDHFYIFTTTGKNLPYDMVKFLLNDFNLELISDTNNNGMFIVKGKIDSLKLCLDRYKSFFENWERIDKRVVDIYEETDDLQLIVRELPYFFENRDGIVNKEEYNSTITNIVERLNKLKIY